jgi:SAM-dependent methyltransferase
MAEVNPPTAGDFEFAALRWAVNYRLALLREFAPSLRGEVIEVGAGIGQNTALLRQSPGVNRVLAVEPDARFCQEFRRLLPGQPLLEGIAADLPADTQCEAIVSINVLEHIREDEAELAAYARLLRPRRGALCLFVPARPEIYAPIDADFGHFRRYTRPELRGKLARAGLVVERLDYFNWVGYFLWALNFRLLRRRQFDAASVRWFDRLIFPVVHWMELRIMRPPFGQSLLAIARSTVRPTG